MPEDRAKDFRDGEDELTVGNGQVDVAGDPAGGLQGTALVAGGTVVAGFGSFVSGGGRLRIVHAPSYSRRTCRTSGHHFQRSL